MMYLPNYQNGSIVNLMSSVLHAFGGTSPYAPLPSLPPSALGDARNVVLLIIDGLGYEYLRQSPQETLFHRHLTGEMTSVFPSTTAAGITTFLSGVAPQQHAMTGWFMHLKELGAVATSLRFQPRCCEVSFSRKNGLKPETVLTYSPIFERINRRSYVVNPKSLARTDYSTVANKFAQPIHYTTLSGCLRQIKRIVTSSRDEKFIYVYWGAFDSLCHEHGTTSAEVAAHFQEMATHLTAWLDSLHNTSTMLIITADHGLIDTPRANVIEVKRHPEFRETLILPLCGEPRLAYCYVRPSRVAQFKRYIEQHFQAVCDLYNSEELIQNNYFGLFEPDKRLFDRVGDYVLIMRDNYAIKDFLLGEEEKFHVGNHGGVSKEEMFVPLIIIEM